jgi:Asp-tRNA(Asn)/Glu-tRNA(Gln) amidotransferase A subunit family amidase
VEIASLTVHETQALLRAKEVSPKEVIEALGRRIELVDPLIHGYLSYDLDREAPEAKGADLSLR